MFLIVLFGVFLFTSMWESNPRYLLTFAPALAACGADGLAALGSKLLKKGK